MLTAAPHQVKNLEAEAKHLTQQYESRMLELEAKMRQNEEEVEALKKNWRLLTRMLPEDLRRRNSLHEQYEEKVKQITDQLIALKKQRWEQESQHLERHKAKSDVKHEITWMQAQQSENQMKHVHELEGVTASLLCDSKECGMDAGWRPAAMSENLIGSLEKYRIVGSCVGISTVGSLLLVMMKVALVKTVTIVSRVLLEVSVGCATDEQQDLIRQALVVGT
ncbi:unnamed protein product, partial [Sphagnum compactum]